MASKGRRVAASGISVRKSAFGSLRPLLLGSELARLVGILSSRDNLRWSTSRKRIASPVSVDDFRSFEGQGASVVRLSHYKEVIEPRE